MTQLVDIANRSLEKVIGRYAQAGIVISRFPKVTYFDELAEMNPQGVALVLHEMTNTSPQENQKKIGIFLTEQEFRKAYEVTVSDSAIAEYSECINEAARKMYSSEDGKNEKIKDALKKYQDSGADILLFRPFQTTVASGQNEIDFVLAHEFWHVVETEVKMIQHSPLITEGTATYAAGRNVSQMNFTPVSQCVDPTQSFYLGSAHLLSTIVDSHQNPYIALLDTSIRADAETQFVYQLKQHLVSMILRSDRDVTKRAGKKYQLLCVPEFRQLDGNANKQTLLKVYRDLGANLLATELETQDVSKAINRFKLLGF